MMDENQIGLLL